MHHNYEFCLLRVGDHKHMRAHTDTHTYTHTHTATHTATHTCRHTYINSNAPASSTVLQTAIWTCTCSLRTDGDASLVVMCENTRKNMCAAMCVQQCLWESTCMRGLRIWISIYVHECVCVALWWCE